MEIEWSKAMVTRLIDMYKERRCLYDSRIQSSREQRRACIQEIASELGMTDAAVKRKLHNLRSAYGREKYLIEKRRSVNVKSSHVKRWFHYERLRFLDEVFSPKAWVLQPTTSTNEQATEDSVKLELDDDEDQYSLPTLAVSAAAAEQSSKRQRCLECDCGRLANDSDVLFGQFVAAELREITDPAKKLYTKLLIHNVINTSMSQQ